MPFYMKKPVVIAAHQLTKENLKELAQWCGGRAKEEPKPSDPTDVAYWLEIPTLEGTMHARIGDYIIKGVQGEFYSCREDIFEQTYEPVARAQVND